MIHPSARLGRNVTVHPSAVIEADVEIGDDCSIAAGAVLRPGTVLGPGSHIGVGVVIAEPPADFAWQGEMSYVRIGSDNRLREYVTVHRATGPGAATVIGDSNLIMPYCHIAHNCRIGNRTTITNFCQLAGFVEVGDNAVLGGMTGVHQFVRIGRLAMVGACSYLARDMPPFMIGNGNPCRVRGLNLLGLRRAGFSPGQLRQLRELFRIAYRSELSFAAALMMLEDRFGDSAEVKDWIVFVRSSKRGLTPYR